MHQIPVKEMMQHAVITTHPEALVADAAQLLEEFRIRRLPVVDQAGCLVGIVTETDIREAEAANQPLNNYEPGAEEHWLTVGDIMTREVITIPVTATVGELAIKLMEHKVSGLPVVEPEPQNPQRLHLVGIVSETDIFRLIADAWRQSMAAA
jgi:acetoin utilization protein AcuB